MLRARNDIVKYISSFLDMLFPGKCLLCGENLIFKNEPFFPVCSSCFNRLKPIAAVKRCRVCSIPLVSEIETCTRCRERSFAFTSNFSLFEYRGLMKELIYQYKFRGRRRVALILSRFLAEEILKNYSGISVVPVPARKYTLRRRGWDHIELILKIMEKSFGIQILKLLKRKGNIPQKALDYQMRVENIRGTIYLKKKHNPKSSVILLDDIFTTGATVDECARILGNAGIEKIDVLTLAID